ncbi:MAG: type IV secretion system protein [Proteobacteria bacterium]|nr:type IV secretion system protein [Pseudomonadota bacterium]
MTGCGGAHRQAWLMLLVAVLCVLLPEAAYAFQLLECDGAGGVVPGSALFYAERGAKGSGDGACGYQGIKHIFSTVLCNFLVVLNDILGVFYCSMQFILVETLRIVLTLYVAVFGAQLFMGTAQLNARDIIMRLVKIALVWTFATQSTWGIGVLFYAAIAFIVDGSSWVVNTLNNIAAISIGDCNDPNIYGGNFMPMFLFFDCMVYSTFVGPMQVASVKLMGLFVALMVVYPPLAGLAIWWVTKTFVAMVKAVVSLLMAFASLAFLVALAPIFLAMMLFQVTSSFFENWLRYMVAYCVQVIMTFGIIVMWLLVFLQFLSFFTQLGDLIFPAEPMMERTSQVLPQDAWGICPPEYSDNPSTGAPEAFCPSGFNPYEKDPITGADNPNWRKDAEKIKLPSALIQDGKFLYYVFYHLVSLIIITYAFSVVLDQAPEISQSIAGATAMPTILGGLGVSNFGKTAGLGSPFKWGKDKLSGGGAPPPGRGAPPRGGPPRT